MSVPGSSAPVSPTTNPQPEAKTIPVNERMKKTLTCPATQFLFHTPALIDCPSKHNIEMDYAKKLLAESKPCPCCRGSFTKFEINRDLREIAIAFFEQHPELITERYEPEAEEKKADEIKREVKVDITPVSDPLNAPYIDLSSAELTQQHQIMDEIARRNQLLQVNTTPAPVQVPVPAQRTTIAVAMHALSVPASSPSVSQSQATQTEVKSPSREAILRESDPFRLLITPGTLALQPQSTRRSTQAARVEVKSPSAIRQADPRPAPRDLRSSHTGSSSSEPALKVIMIGDSNAGKTQFLRRYVEEHNTPSFITTIGIDFILVNVEVNGQKRKLKVWDTAGQERFRSITSAYYRGCNAIFLIYNVTDEASFQHLRNWKFDIDQHAPPNTPMVLIGTHCDEEDLRVVETSRGQAFADEFEIPFFECSAGANININEAFLALAQAAVARETPQQSASTVTLSPVSEAPKSKCC